MCARALLMNSESNPLDVVEMAKLCRAEVFLMFAAFTVSDVSTAKCHLSTRVVPEKMLVCGTYPWPS